MYSLNVDLLNDSLKMNGNLRRCHFKKDNYCLDAIAIPIVERFVQYEYRCQFTLQYNRLVLECLSEAFESFNGWIIVDGNA